MVFSLNKMSVRAAKVLALHSCKMKLTSPLTAKRGRTSQTARIKCTYPMNSVILHAKEPIKSKGGVAPRVVVLIGCCFYIVPWSYLYPRS